MSRESHRFQEINIFLSHRFSVISLSFSLFLLICLRVDTCKRRDSHMVICSTKVYREENQNFTNWAILHNFIRLGPQVQTLYQQLGFNWSRHQCNSSFSLPYFFSLLCTWLSQFHPISLSLHVIYSERSGIALNLCLYFSSCHLAQFVAM